MLSKCTGERRRGCITRRRLVEASHGLRTSLGWVNSNAVGTPRRCTSARLCVYVPVDVRRRARWGDLLTQFVENMTQPRATRSLSLCTPLSISARLFRSLSRPLALRLLPFSSPATPPASSSCYLVPLSRSSVAYSAVLLADPVLTFHARSVFLRAVRTSFFRLPLPSRSLRAFSTRVSRARTLLLAKSRARCLFYLSLSLYLSFVTPLALERSLTLTFSLPRIRFATSSPRPSSNRLIYSALSHTLSRISDRTFLP